jgi:YYY domain-containing protein
MRKPSSSSQFSSTTVRILAALVSLVLVFGVAAAVRLYKIDWDEGNHLHPDERYLTMVVSAIRFPGEMQPLDAGGDGGESRYWDTANSPLNPTNQGYAGYVYGTLPLFATRALGLWMDRACPSVDAPTPAPLPHLLHRMLSEDPCLPGHYAGYGGAHLVGRGLSTMADLATLVGLAVLGWLLYDTRTAIFAAALYAFTVLPIQHAHFFVVDSFATVLVVWTLCFCVASIRTRRLWLLLPAGLVTGLAVASKISVWPLALIVALAGFYRPDERNGAPGYRWRLDGPSLLALSLSGLLAAAAFRVGQPYAFTGPRFFNIRIEPQWLKTMQDTSELMRGLRDVPFGHQWANRSPIVFPLRNMIVWGMGIPLGLAAWIGWGAMGWQMLRRRAWRYLIPWAWSTLFFLYQATQWVKSMRYLLPVYPVFVLFAAWLVVQALDRAWRSLRPGGETRASTSWWPRTAGVMGGIAALIVLLGTVVWGLAFLSIYRRPVTRIEASRWIYDNVPTVATLQTDDGRSLNVPYQPDVVLSRDGGPLHLRFKASEDVRVTGVTLTRVEGDGMGGLRSVKVTFAEGYAATATSIAADDNRALSFSLSAPVDVQAGESPVLMVSLEEGPPLRLRSSILANEHWDDPLPLRMEGKDPFWNWYRGLSSSPSTQMNNYDADTLEKRRNLLNWLDEADYIVLSSNRLYASIPRLPDRYPLTTEYYRLLFEGSLGFEFAASFVSYPALGPCQFPDQESPFPLIRPAYTTARSCSIDLPPAEEAFSVYDHPTVLIFAKTDTYSRAQASALLPVSLLDDVRWMTPREATRGEGPAEDRLVMSPHMRIEQEAGGTWSELFSYGALQNRFQVIAVILWALLLALLGWIAYPILFTMLPALRYRGYALSRVVGLLLWSYLAWLLASLRLLPYTRWVLWLLLVGLCLVSAWLAYRRRESLVPFVREHWRHILTVEVIFTVLYLAWVLVRLSNPDLWHPARGGEKPMDFAYLNAVIKSTWFPPYDPWFAGGKINYYYFGFVLVANLTKALGIVPSIAYNLAVPSFFALTGVGAYAVTLNLAGGDDRRRWHRAGLWAILLVLILGNLGEIKLIVDALDRIGNVHFESLIPGYPTMISSIVGLWRVVAKGAPLAIPKDWWYWNARSMIPIYEGEVGPINEFPAFTFLYADLHAHMLALPLTGIALALALQWGLSAHRLKSRAPANASWWRRLERWFYVALPRPVSSVLLAAVVVGALRATNTWDYPTYLGLMAAGFIIGLLARELSSLAPQDAPSPLELATAVETTSSPADTSTLSPNLSSPGTVTPATTLPGTWGMRVLAGFVTPVVLIVGSGLLFRPFIANYALAYTSFKLWEGSRTPLKTYFMMYGHLVFPIILAALVGLFFKRVSVRKRGTFPTQQGANEDTTPVQRTLARLDLDDLLWPVVVILGVLVMLVLLLGYVDVWVAPLVVPLGGIALYYVGAASTRLRRRLLWFWVGTALALSLLVEVVVLGGDIGRMNTVFKFYFQVWMLFGLVAAVFVERMLHAPLGLLALRAAEPQTQTPGVLAEELSGEAASVEMSADGRLHDRWPWLRPVNDVAVVIIALLLFGALLYPVFAIPARAEDRWIPGAPRSLDGMAYMPYAVQFERDAEMPLSVDYRVIRWLQENIEGSPTIIEGLGFREYLWSNRISVYTGLPAVVGWRWHQVQQRMVMPPFTVENRQQDVNTFYNTQSPEIALNILKRYEVDYVILAPYERAYMLPEGAGKFERMVERGWLEMVYQDGPSTIYRVTG